MDQGHRADESECKISLLKALSSGQMIYGPCCGLPTGYTAINSQTTTSPTTLSANDALQANRQSYWIQTEDSSQQLYGNNNALFGLVKADDNEFY